MAHTLAAVRRDHDQVGVHLLGLVEDAGGGLAAARLDLVGDTLAFRDPRCFKKLSAQDRHQLRIALKKLRYTAEFFRSLYQKKREKAYFHTLAQMQNSLGHMNDIVVADHLLERLSAARVDQGSSDRLSTAAGIVAGWYTQSASSSEHQAEANWREFCRCDAFW
jgi:CHAD domain-containing protein